jgi:hypothetical protein
MSHTVFTFGKRVQDKGRFKTLPEELRELKHMTPTDQLTVTFHFDKLGQPVRFVADMEGSEEA